MKYLHAMNIEKVFIKVVEPFYFQYFCNVEVSLNKNLSSEKYVTNIVISVKFFRI